MRASLWEDTSATGFYAMVLHDEILHPRLHGLSSSPESSSLALGTQEHQQCPCASQGSGFPCALLQEKS